MKTNNQSTKPINVLAIAADKYPLPSARFRIQQHIEPLKNDNIMVDLNFPLIKRYAQIPGLQNRIASYLLFPIKLGARLPSIINSHKADITWLQRGIMIGAETFEKNLKRPLVYDLDDAIWTNSDRHAKTLKNIAKYATVITAGNEYIANWFSKYHNNIQVVPTAIDTTRFTPAQNENDRFTIGWTGRSDNLKHLELVEPALKKFLSNNADAKLLVVCNEQPDLNTLPDNSVEFIKWSAEEEAKSVQRMDVGIMPLIDNEWTRGKCSFKMLQYMACGIPVIVSPVGMNKTVLSKANVGISASKTNEWHEAFTYLYNNRDKGTLMGEAGRKLAENNYSTKVIANQLAEIFKKLK